MSKMKDLRKKMKKQLKEFGEQIEAFGEQADAVEAATLKRSQEQVVNLVEVMDAQLRIWQRELTPATTQSDVAQTNGASLNLNAATAAVWNRMQKQIQQWLTATATMRMEMGADAMWQLEALRALDATTGEKLRTLKSTRKSAQGTVRESAEQALDDLKHALERVLPD